MKINFIHILFITTTLAMGPIANAAYQHCPGTQTEKVAGIIGGDCGSEGVQGGNSKDEEAADDAKTGLDIAQDLADL